MGILFCVIHCTPGEGGGYKLYIALQVVRTLFLGPTPSFFPLPLLVLTLFM